MRCLTARVTSDGRADRLGEFQGVNRKLFAGSNPKERKLEDKKQKYAYWMRPSMVAEMEEMLDSANATSKSDFVCQAVDFLYWLPATGKKYKLPLSPAR